MELKRAMDVLESARKEQSCDLADGLIDSLMPYWEIIEEAFGNILSDGECIEALDAVAGDDGAMAELDAGHAGFFTALVARYKKGTQAKGDAVMSPVVAFPGTLASDYPDVADFIANDLYEAFSVPDAFGVFEIVVFPRTCVVTAEYLPGEGGTVSGYVIGNGKMLLVTRDGDEVTDVRYAEATTNNIHLVMTQGSNRSFDWDAVESPDHDVLRRDGAFPKTE